MSMGRVVSFVVFSLVGFLALCCCGFQVSWAQQGMQMEVNGDTMHVSAQKSIRDLENDRLELRGQVYVRRLDDSLTADYVLIDLKTHKAHAEGRVVYTTMDQILAGESADINLLTKTGTFYKGQVMSDRYRLEGVKLDRLGPGVYVGTDADYTTCRDCPSSWKIHGDKIRMTIQGYARISNFKIKINDSPVIYLPYVVIPVKTRRQSGLLYPKMKSGSQIGFQYIQPFFWAINDQMDATIDVGRLSQRGLKGDVEFRYAAAKRSQGTFNIFGFHDNRYSGNYKKRWAIKSSHRLELPFKVDFKLNYLDSSDRDYPRLFPEDIPGLFEPSLVSEVGVSRNGNRFAFSASTSRIKNLLREDFRGFDRDTVQQIPSLTMASLYQKPIPLIPVYFGFQLRADRFWRPTKAVDIITEIGEAPPPAGTYLPGRDPIRRATRFSLIPEIYTHFPLFGQLSVTPHVQYKGFVYSFDNGVASTTTRGYLQTQLEVATTFEKLVHPMIMHRVRPSLIYSRIPFSHQDENHPFVRQLNYLKRSFLDGSSGRQLDDFDIVPISQDSPYYLTPLGHSLTYQISHGLILKREDKLEDWQQVPEALLSVKKPEPSKYIRVLGPKSAVSERKAYKYQKVLSHTVGHTIDFMELKKTSGTKRPLWRAFSNLNIDLKRLTLTNQTYYYPYEKKFQYNFGAQFFFSQYARRLVSFERSIFLGYSRDFVTTRTHSLTYGFSWSVNDFLSAHYRQNMDLLTHRTLSYWTRITYHSMSQCFLLGLTLEKTIDRGLEFSPIIMLNLTGNEYVDFSGPNGVSMNQALTQQRRF